MARAKDQKRWRQSSSKRKIEAYLHADTAERLDALVAAQGGSRASVLSELIEAASADTDIAAVTGVSRGEQDAAATKKDANVDTAPTASEPTPNRTADGLLAPLPAYRLRKAPGQAPGGGDAYWVEISGERVGKVWRANPKSKGWRANKLRTAIKPVSGRTRADAVRSMLRVVLEY